MDTPLVFHSALIMKLSSNLTLSSTRTPDPASAGIDRFAGLAPIEPENLPRPPRVGFIRLPRTEAGL